MRVKTSSTIYTFRAFQNRSYRLLWPANFFVYLCRYMQMTTLAWLVLELTNSPWRVALVGFFFSVPMLLLGMVGGMLADRVRRKRLLMTTQAMNFVAALVMTVLLFTGLTQPWHAYLMILITGTSWALDSPSRRSVNLDLLGRSGVTNAIAIDTVGAQISKMVGPAVAGLLILLVDVKGGYAAVTVFYLAGVLLLRKVELPSHTAIRPPAASPGASGGRRAGLPYLGTRPDPYRSFQDLFRSLGQGFRYVRGHPALRATLLITIIMNLLAFTYVDMVPVIARNELHVGPGLMGILVAADGLGALVGAVLIASRANVRYHGRVYLGGSILALLALLLFAFSPWYVTSLPVLIVLGLGAAGFGTMQSTIVMLVAREEMRGRALGVLSICIGSGPFGSLLVGGVASAISPRFAIGMNACIGLVTIALVALLLPALRGRTQVESARASGG